MQTWNFHNYIAFPLENYCRKHIGNSWRTADDIANGEFVNVMFTIIENEFGTLEDVRAFVEMCNDFANLPAAQIPKDKAQEIFNEFERIMKT